MSNFKSFYSPNFFKFVKFVLAYIALFSFVLTKRRTMAAAVGMVSKRTRTSPCWDDEVDARNAEASESGGDSVIFFV